LGDTDHQTLLNLQPNFKPIVMKKLILLLLALPFLMHAQITTMKGTVYEKPNLPLTNATVKLTKDLIFIKSLMTDANGAFRFDYLEPGDYRVETSYVGMESHLTIVIISENGKLSSLNINMEEAQVPISDPTTVELRIISPFSDPENFGNGDLISRKKILKSTSK
jgi:Carboxypeptidase regulatory-like domain